MNEFQLTESQWTTLKTAYLGWLEEQWRNVSKGHYFLKPEKETEVLRLIYFGMGFNEICRTATPHKMTTARVGRHLMEFLADHPEFPEPRCACGKHIWHRGVCPVRDRQFPASAKNGLATQARKHRERQADIFFQTINQAKAMTDTLTAPTPTIDSKIDRFAELVQRGIDAWTEAGRLLVEMLEESPDARQLIIERSPDITPEILSRFEAIGRQQLHPKTLLNNSPGMRRLRALPFSEQSRYLNEPVPVLIRTERGVETLKVAVQNLTTQQAYQVLTPSGVRSPEAQRAWIESKTPVKAHRTAPYVIRGHKVIFRQETELSAKELAQILAQLAA